jgi:hypothetical protein
MDEWRMTVLKREHEVVSSLKDRAHLIVNKDYQVQKA